MTEPPDRIDRSEGSTTQADSDEAYCAACNQSFALDHEFCPNDGAKLVKLKARPDMLLGRVFDGRYEVRAALGHGGMGTVYRGWQRSVDREVAIKVIHPKLASERAVAKRFLREARLSSRLSQPNIVNVYDFGQSDDGILYLVMELLRGHTLSRELESGRPLAPRRVRGIATQICDALDAAHTQGIIHRDLKPGNIMILDDPPGRDLIKILDFGLAKSLVAETTSLVTQTDALLGTPLYMPPEQILGKPSDQRADLYSLGCILFQMAAGRPPFIGDNINATLAAHVQNAPPPLPPHVPAALAGAIHKLMNKNPADRFATAREVHDAVDSLLESSWGRVSDPSVEVGLASMLEPASGGTGGAAAPAVPSSSSIPPVRRTRWWIPMIGLMAVITTIAIVFAATRDRSGAAPRDVAGAAPDSAAAAAADAEGIAELDAPTVILDAAVDAGRVTPDARPRVRPDAGVVRPRITPDAAPVTRPVDAGAPRVIDAPDLDYLPTKKK